MTNAEVYASLGAGGDNVITSSVSEHEAAMLNLDVAVRDGDDEIKVENPYGSFEEDENNQRVLVGDNDGNETPDTESGDESETQENPEDIPEIPEPPKELEDISTQLHENEEGFYEMAKGAIDKGLLTEEQIEGFMDEYYEKGTLSEEVLGKLEEAGFTRTFVKSYIKGQEALATKYENQIYEYAGGKDNYAKIMGHLETENPKLIDTFIKAVGERDLATVQAIFKTARESTVRKYGKPAERSVAKKAVAQPQATEKETKGFASKAEMVKAMSDKRYGVDRAYTLEVERKVHLM